MGRYPLLLFLLLSLVSLHVRIRSVLAEIPTTAKITFWATREGNRDIYVMNPDGSEQIRITYHRADDITPVWSPTGEQILFVSDRDGFWDLYLMDPNGSNVRRVFGKEAKRASPAWSPDGKQIAYTRTVHDQWVNYTATIDGEDEERISVGSSPAWSPDGTEIAFLVGWPKSMQISIFNLDTLKQKILFPLKAIPSYMSGSLAWSPTGDKLAFAWLHRVPLKDFIETETIYTINRNGMGLTQIVDEAGPRATSVVWSPHGDSILYKQADKNNNLQIFKRALGGEQPEQLTHIGQNYLGDWFDPAFALPVSPQPQLLSTVWGKVKKR